MMTNKNQQQGSGKPIVFIVSGGMGISGEQLVQTALAQFEGIKAQLEIIPHVLQPEQVETAVDQAATAGGLIVHTLVDVELRQHLIRLARKRNVVAVDLMGRLLSQLSRLLEHEPLGHPGLYRQLRQAYFDRVEAIEFTVSNDDGRNPRDWPQAEIVLVGVSRVGKTPLSMYLSVQGWKVVNVPLVPGMPLPPELLALDRRRVVGLTIDPGQLVSHRERRQRRLGVPGGSAYTNPTDIYEELVAMGKLYRRHGFAVVDITDKPIEESADEVIAQVTRRLRNSSS
ncbi:MAG: pyruvate, water dikinase regulatory protein [Chloroflexota bacterium]